MRGPLAPLSEVPEDSPPPPAQLTPPPPHVAGQAHGTHPPTNMSPGLLGGKCRLPGPSPVAHELGVPQIPRGLRASRAMVMARQALLGPGRPAGTREHIPPSRPHGGKSHPQGCPADSSAPEKDGFLVSGPRDALMGKDRRPSPEARRTPAAPAAHSWCHLPRGPSSTRPGLRPSCQETDPHTQSPETLPTPPSAGKRPRSLAGLWQKQGTFPPV